MLEWPGGLLPFQIDGVRVLVSTPDVLLADDDVYPWVFWVLHGHQLDHLRIIEPWVATLRARGMAIAR